MASFADDMEKLKRARDAGILSASQFDLLVSELAQRADGSSGGGRSPASEPDAQPAGSKLGSYELLGELGRGGMGVVYRARHRLDSKARRQGGEVALKLMHAQLAGDAEYRARFEREATLGLDLSHPGIVQVFDLV